MKQSSLSKRFILGVLALGQALLWIWFAQDQRGHLAEALESRIRIAADLLSTVSATAIVSYNYSYLDQYLEVLSKDEDVLSVRVKDRMGNTIRERTVRQETRQRSINPFYLPWSNQSRMPVSSGGETIGTIDIAYSSDRVNRDVRHFLIVSCLGQVLLFGFIAYAVSLVFRKTLEHPVARMGDALSRATDGDLTVDIPEMEKSEIGTIAKGIRFLVQKLSQTVDRANSVSGNITTAADQLTHVLHTLNEGTEKEAKSLAVISGALKAADENQAKVKEKADHLAMVSSENVSSLLEMQSTAEEIAASTGRLFQSAEDSYAMVAETSQTAKILAGNAGEIFRAVESVSASVEEIGSSVTAISENAEQSAEQTSHLRLLLTDRGTVAVADAVAAVEEIIRQVDHSAEIIDRLHDRSRNIERVLSVIREVTESTNLLSLNAAILAAQAGEYGKSFSVVADEIRALSDRTSSSARDIAQIIRTIQGEIGDAVTSIRSGVTKAESGKEQIFRAGEAMGESLEAAQRSAKTAEVIQKATEEQATALRHITLSMENVRRMTEEMARATDEQKRGSHHMLDVISNVKEVAELVKRGTEEHAAGTRTISKNLELTKEMAGEITRSAQEQEQTNAHVVILVGQMKDTGADVFRNLQEVTLSFNTLKDEIESLKREIGVFRTAAVARNR